jgi:chromosome segregation ATPase
MTKPKLRKNADISPAQSPHDGIHTCSKGCKKPGCTRTLRETIEEQNQQIEALKRDVLEKTAELRKSEEHNEALCERMQDLNSEIFTASNINGKLHMKRVHDLNQMGGQCEEIARLKADLRNCYTAIRVKEEEKDRLRFVAEDNKRECEATRIENARLKAEVERLTAFTTRTIIPNEELQAQVERLTKAGDAMADQLHGLSFDTVWDFWNAAKEGKGQP